ncbi:MAG: hypothetical protein WCP97_07405 [bacterium]
MKFRLNELTSNARIAIHQASQPLERVRGLEQYVLPAGAGLLVGVAIDRLSKKWYAGLGLAGVVAVGSFFLPENPLVSQRDVLTGALMCTLGNGISSTIRSVWGRHAHGLARSVIRHENN